MNAKVRSIPHPHRNWLVEVAGWLAVLLSLALLLPGVVATAHAEPADAAPAGPSCQAGPSAEQAAIGLEKMVQNLRAQIEAQADPSEDVVVLNTSGFNYRPTPPPASSDPR